jgi:hypothetical protein
MVKFIGRCAEKLSEVEPLTTARIHAGELLWARSPAEGDENACECSYGRESGGVDQRCSGSGEVDTVGELDAECIGCTDKCAPIRVAREGAYFERD